MSTKASVSAATSHTCIVLTSDEEKRIESLDSEVEKARTEKDRTLDPETRNIAISVLAACRYERRETQETMERSKRPSCPACSLALQPIRVSLQKGGSNAPSSTRASSAGSMQNPYVDEGWWKEFGLQSGEKK